MTRGFFTRADVGRVRKAPARGKREVSADTLRKLGPAGVRDMNPDAQHPEIEPTGAESPLVYVLGEAPGREEDEQGAPFVGPSGKMLRAAIPRRYREDTRFDNCVRTRPPNNRKPTKTEVECFRDVVAASIEQAAPRLVLGIGAVPLAWATGLTNIKPARGKLFPIKVGDHACWFMPVLHPAFLIRIAERREDKVPGKEWVRLWKTDIVRAYRAASGGEVAEVVSPVEAVKGVRPVMSWDGLCGALDHLAKADAVGFDLETHRLRPYSDDACILSVAISDGEVTYAIPVDHDEAPWSEVERRALGGLLLSFFESAQTKVAHNLPFDLEWLMVKLGEPVSRGGYGCSLQAAYVLDPGPPGRGGSHSLDFQCLHRFGLPLKSLTEAAKARARLREMRLDKLLEYNAVDAKWCLRLWRALMRDVDDQGLIKSYDLQMRRVVPIVRAQMYGVPIDQRVTKQFVTDFEAEADKVSTRISARPEVREYEKTVGPFNPASPKVVGQLLGDVMKLDGVILPSGSYSTRASILNELKGEHPIVADLLALRSVHKLKGTYVDRFLPDHPDSYVYRDGKIHCHFGIATTRTARLSSEHPNNQNWPKRKNKEVRKQLAAPKGSLFVSVDQGQIEARVLAMESKDRRWIKMIRENYDVHKEWAEKIVGICPAFLERHGGDMKAARSTAKNGWVFPAFYGSSVDSILRNLDLPEEEGSALFEEFWRTFRGIKRWQWKKWAEYEEEGCVWSLTGRRRLGPLSFNMVVNTPIQTTASDICVDAMVRLSNIAHDGGMPWLQPVLQIHDDLVFIMPESKLGDGIAVVVEEQLAYEADWLNVPLAVEVEVGPNLMEMESVGTWSG